MLEGKYDSIKLETKRSYHWDIGDCGFFFAQDHKSIHCRSSPSAYLSVAILERKSFDKSWLDPHLDLLQPLVKKRLVPSIQSIHKCTSFFCQGKQKRWKWYNPSQNIYCWYLEIYYSFYSISYSTDEAFYSKFESQSDARPLDKQCPAIKWVLYNQQPTTHVALTSFKNL